MYRGEQWRILLPDNESNVSNVISFMKGNNNEKKDCNDT